MYKNKSMNKIVAAFLKKNIWRCTRAQRM